MNKQDEEKGFLNAVSKELDQRVDTIDDSTRAALRSIRKQAIALAHDKSGNSWQWWQPYPVIAITASIALVMSVTLRINMTASMDDFPELKDIAMLMASDDIGFYQDLEFYQWLEAEKING